MKRERESPLPHPLRKKRRAPHCEKIARVLRRFWGKGEERSNKERERESPLPHPLRKKRRAPQCEKNSLSSQGFLGEGGREKR